MVKTKKIKAAGKFKAHGGGVSVRKGFVEVESKQRKKQSCPFCRKTVKRVSKGIWKCSKCNKKFASNIFYID